MTWLDDIRTALREQAESSVPCEGCTACCRSAQFVHIGPDETDTLAHIPGDLLFPAPGKPGHLVMGYNEWGHARVREWRLTDDVSSVRAGEPTPRAQRGALVPAYACPPCSSGSTSSHAT
jgi:hypothetical protein